VSRHNNVQLLSYSLVYRLTDSRRGLCNTQASALSRISWSWVTEVLRAGYKRQLSDADMCPLDHEYSVEYNVALFEPVWAKEQLAECPSLLRAVWRVFRRCVCPLLRDTRLHPQVPAAHCFSLSSVGRLLHARRWVETADRRCGGLPTPVQPARVPYTWTLMVATDTERHRVLLRLCA
jgi:hypothetical protein